jgi:hypothetical protein
MKVLPTILPVCLALILWGCTREEEPPPLLEKPKVVKPIVKPVEKVAETRPPITEEEGIPQADREDRIESASLAQDAAEPATQEPDREPPGRTEEAGYYTVESGDSLATVAARPDVYNNVLKWPALYRLNADKLGDMEPGADLPDRELAEGLKLRFITPEEARKNLEANADEPWVVNVLSATKYKRIVPATIGLIQQGYPVYLTSAVVEGKEWMRLRIGFFKSRSEAEAEGERIMAKLDFADSWTTKIGGEELDEYGGFGGF